MNNLLNRNNTPLSYLKKKVKIVLIEPNRYIQRVKQLSRPKFFNRNTFLFLLIFCLFYSLNTNIEEETWP